ncbi:hypothetical protein LIG30_1354 [Burkholderia sp. lig30]|jgi:hypothetical protein|uniref:hypothetical protein n=1 Tax=Burkholderia sp. lig30 TaxID=1192124 RepID=UPI000461D407|nr:hypothetical protein [Burkholderia sp. lig30]KDB09614.1 hypothetical protein LIG30_1354 [Burkholderia sp. lig30]
MPNPDDDYVLVHDTATTNRTPGSKVYVDINTTPICPDMSNEQFAETVLRARDAAVGLIKDRIAAVARWDANEQARATTYFGRADAQIRVTLSSGLPRLLAAMQELVPEKNCSMGQPRQQESDLRSRTGQRQKPRRRMQTRLP